MPTWELRPRRPAADERGQVRRPRPAEQPECAREPALFLHPLLEDPPSGPGGDDSRWTEYQRLLARVRRACAACPRFADCLYQAVVQVDISGYVGCTTMAERAAIRRELGISVPTEDLDSAAGVRGTRRPVDHDDVLRMRAQHPHDSLEQLAARLDCSLSTVKRHLRRARAGDRGQDAERRPPTVEDVLDAFDEVVEQPRTQPNQRSSS